MESLDDSSDVNLASENIRMNTKISAKSLKSSLRDSIKKVD